MKKENKTHNIQARYTESEYFDVLLKISDENGELLMKPSEFSKLCTLDGNAIIRDKELDEYKVFIISKISNNFNQLVKRLNKDNLNNKITDETYIKLLEELEKLNEKLTTLSEPFTE